MLDSQRLQEIRERLEEGSNDDELEQVAYEMLKELERLNNPDDPPTVMLESPYAGDVAANEDYARRCMLNSLRLGEAPFAGHLLYTQVLKDANPTERKLGIRADLAWLRRSRGVVLHTDRGVSSGMKQALELGMSLDLPIKERKLEGYDGN